MARQRVHATLRRFSEGKFAERKDMHETALGKDNGEERIGKRQRFLTRMIPARECAKTAVDYQADGRKRILAMC